MERDSDAILQDKLAMRMRAASGIRVPEFALRCQNLCFLERGTRGPWVLKPKLMAGARRKFYHAQDVWDRIHSLGTNSRSSYWALLYQEVARHVDSIWFRGKMVFAVTSAYGTRHQATGGGIFTTRSYWAARQQADQCFGL